MALNNHDEILWTGTKSVAVGGAKRPLTLTLYKPSPPSASFVIIFYIINIVKL